MMAFEAASSRAHQTGPAQPRTFRLRILDTRNGQIKVELTVPIGLVSVAQRLGAQLLPAGSSMDEIVAQAGRQGVAELAWDDAANDERLELTLE